jgi:hypothetical protein
MGTVIMRVMTLAILLVAGVAVSQLHVINPFFRAAILKPASAGGSASCPADGSPDIDQATQDNGQSFGQNSDFGFVGEKATDATTRQICKVRSYLTLEAGSVTAKFYTCRIYTMSGNDLNTVVATSDSIAGNNSWAGTAVIFTFVGNPTLTGGTEYARVVYSSNSSGVPVGVDAANFISYQIKETTNPLANNQFNSWATNLVVNSLHGGTTDGKMSLYWYD